MDRVTLYGRFPPVEKMDQSLNHLGHVKFLSLSTNNISQIANLGGCASLETLSLGRNQIKNLGGLDPVSDTLENLWISYNNIEKLSGIEKLKKLTHLLMSNNRVSSWAEFERLVFGPLQLPFPPSFCGPSSICPHARARAHALSHTLTPRPPCACQRH